MNLLGYDNLIQMPFFQINNSNIESFELSRFSLFLIVRIDVSYFFSMHPETILKNKKYQNL